MLFLVLVKVKLYNTLIVSVLVYGAWILADSNERIIDRIERKVSKHRFGT